MAVLKPIFSCALLVIILQLVGKVGGADIACSCDEGSDDGDIYCGGGSDGRFIVGIHEYIEIHETCGIG